jgi:translation initiation factor eIF-2B subunit delta
MSEPAKTPEAPVPAPQQAAEEPKLTPAELKKRAKAEKQARRAAQKEQQGAVGGPQTPNGAPEESKGPKQQDQKPKGGQQKGQQQQQKGKQAAPEQKPMPIRGKPSQGGAVQEPPKKENKQIELFSHLYAQPRRTTLEGAHKEVHPAVQRLGTQISSYEICGSSARCVGMLLAFKEAIQAYKTPIGTSIPRDLIKTCLTPQIEFLKTCRPISESMGNAIRYLKKLIVEIDPNEDEQQVKDYLCEEIDRFVRERITVTDQAIAASASQQIKNGSVILTYAKSAIVEKTILQAHANGTKFRVIVLDSRPLHEGNTLATSFMNAGLEVEYLPYSGISHAVKQATLVLLGAHSMLSNGRLMSRIGTASIAMRAHKSDVPVIVCCESVKFSGKVALDSIVLNEVAPSEELFLPKPVEQQVAAPDQKKDEEDEEEKMKSLHDWKEIRNLQVLNLMYDVTPAEYIRMVICEYGSVPPSSVPVVHRLANEGM